MIKSGYANYDGIWGNAYYDDEAKPLLGLQFTQRTFQKTPALVAIHVKNGFREEVPYVGQPFDSHKWKLVASKWDHEHCAVCQFSIEEGMTYWSTEDNRRLLCDACYGHYLKRKSTRLAE